MLRCRCAYFKDDMLSIVGALRLHCCFGDGYVLTKFASNYFFVAE